MINPFTENSEKILLILNASLYKWSFCDSANDWCRSSCLRAPAELRQITELPVGMLVLKLLLPKLSNDEFLALPNDTLVELKSDSKLKGLLWEHFELPLQTTDGWTVNFCNVGPIIGRRQILFIHDAQIYISPKSYSFWFRRWYRALQPILARRASHLFTVSNYSKNRLEEVCVFPKKSTGDT